MVVTAVERDDGGRLQGQRGCGACKSKRLRADADRAVPEPAHRSAGHPFTEEDLGRTQKLAPSARLARVESTDARCFEVRPDTGDIEHSLLEREPQEVAEPTNGGAWQADQILEPHDVHSLVPGVAGAGSNGRPPLHRDRNRVRVRPSPQTLRGGDDVRTDDGNPPPFLLCSKNVAGIAHDEDDTRVVEELENLAQKEHVARRLVAWDALALGTGLPKKHGTEERGRRERLVGEPGQ